MQDVVLQALAAGAAGACLACGGAVDVLADGAVACGDCGSLLERAGEDDPVHEQPGRRGVWVG
jgi:hypothetical protein